MTKHLIIYHQSVPAKNSNPEIDCPDGVCAAWIVAKYLTSQGESYELKGDSYLNAADYALMDRISIHIDLSIETVWLVDFSYPEHLMRELIQRGLKIILFEHHAGKLNDFDLSQFKNKIQGGIDIQECGATYAWRFCFPNYPRPWFLQHVWSRDTGRDGYYEGKQPISKAIATWMSHKRKGLRGANTFPIFDELTTYSNEQIERAIQEGARMIEETETPICNGAIARWAANPKFINVCGHRVPYIDLLPIEDRLYSLILTQLGHTQPSAAFVVGQTSSEQNTLHLRSLRDNGINFDVSAIAKQLGGGGHHNAAGVTIPDTRVIETMLEVHP